MTDGEKASSIFRWLPDNPGQTGRNILIRTFDILGALAGLLLLAIPLAFIALKVRRNLGTPVLFVQDRPGLGA